MRQQIDVSRKERVVYDKIYRRLEDEYLQMKLDLQKCIFDKQNTIKKRDLTLYQLNQFKIELCNLEKIVDKEWSMIIETLEQEIDIGALVQEQKLDERKTNIKDNMAAKISLLGGMAN